MAARRANATARPPFPSDRMRIPLARSRAATGPGGASVTRSILACAGSARSKTAAVVFSVPPIVSRVRIWSTLGAPPSAVTRWKVAPSPRYQTRTVGAVPTNIDPKTVEDFGREWSLFDQRAVGVAELRRQFDRYFALFPWSDLPEGAVGFDAGCGSGRWSLLLAPRVGRLHCIDASEAAVDVARRNLRDEPNC